MSRSGVRSTDGKALRPPPTTGRKRGPGSGARAKTLGADTMAITLDGSLSQAVVVESFQKYRFSSELGAGGLGVVYLAEDQGLRRELAVKLLRDPSDQGAVADFVEEAQITGQLSHPNIVPVYELGQDPNGCPFLAMKLVSGRTLLDICSFVKRKNGKSNLPSLLKDKRLETFQKVCDAVAYAHSRGVVHRDLKPENVMVGEFGEVLVMDWGLAKPIGVGQRRNRVVNTDLRDTGNVEMTMVGDVFGTPAYMPPEQAHGENDQLDERADIFALGATLYELLTLEPPYTGKTVEQVLDKAKRCRFKPPRHAAPQLEIPRELEAIVLKAMAPDPRQRYRKVTDLRDDIDAFLANEPGSAWSDGMLTRLAKWGKRNPMRAMMSVMVMVVSLVAVLAATVTITTLASAESSRQLAEARAAAEEEARLREVEERKAAEARADAEQEARKAEEEARLNAELRATAEAEARERAELEALAKEGKLEEVQRRLGVQKQNEVERLVNEFARRWDEAQAAGVSNPAFFDSLSPAEVSGYINAIESLEKESEAQGEVFHKPMHLAYLGLLYHMARKDYESAEGAYTRAIEMNPGLRFAIANRGYARMLAGNLEAALEDFNRALELNPDDANLRRNRDNLISRLQAGRSLDERLQHNPNDVEALIERARLRFQAGNSDAALEDVTRAIQLDSENGEAWSLRASYFSEQDQYPLAVPDWEQAARLINDSSTWVNYANALRLNGQHREAIDAATTAFELDDTNWRAMVNRGWSRAELGDRDAAVADLKVAHRLCDDPNWRRRLANDIRQLGG